MRVQRGRGLKNRVQASALDKLCGFKVKPQLWCLILSWPVLTRPPRIHTRRCWGVC